MVATSVKVKKKKRNVSLGVIHVKVTFNNTIVTFSDSQGNVIAASSAGANGFKGAKKSTPYAAQITVENAANQAKESGMRTVSVKISGAGSQREASLRAIFNHGFIVTAITDTSSVPHNGVKPPKRRRV